MILQALETLPSSSASCSRESFLLVLWESVVIWVLRIVGGLAITNLPRRPGWLRPDLTPCVVETGSSQLAENYETSSAIGVRISAAWFLLRRADWSCKPKRTYRVCCEMAASPFGVAASCQVPSGVGN